MSTPGGNTNKISDDISNFIETGINSQIQNSGLVLPNTFAKKLKSILPGILAASIAAAPLAKTDTTPAGRQTEADVIDAFGDADATDELKAFEAELDYLGDEGAPIKIPSEHNEEEDPSLNSKGGSPPKPEDTRPAGQPNHGVSPEQPGVNQNNDETGAGANTDKEQGEPDQGADKAKDAGDAVGNDEAEPTEEESTPQQNSSEEPEANNANQNTQLKDKPQFPQDKPKNSEKNDPAKSPPEEIGPEGYSKRANKKTIDPTKEWRKKLGAPDKNESEEAADGNTDENKDKEKEGEPFKPYGEDHVPEDEEGAESDKKEGENENSSTNEENEPGSEKKKPQKNEGRYERLKEKIQTTTNASVKHLQREKAEQAKILQKLEGRKKFALNSLRLIRARASMIIFAVGVLGPIVLILWLVGIGEIITGAAIPFLRREFTSYKKKSKAAHSIINKVDTRAKPIKKEIENVQKKIQGFQSKGQRHLNRLNKAYGRQ